MKTLLTYTFFNRLAIILIALSGIALSVYIKPGVRTGDSPSYTMVQNGQTYTYRQPTNKLLSMWSVWDTKWYVSIAENGYSTQKAPFTRTDNRGFLPLYAICLWVFGTFLFFGNIHLAGIVLSNIFLILALIYAKKLVEGEPKLKHEVNIKDMWWYVLLFPTSYYLSAIYPESLFLLLSILVFYLTQKKQFVWGIFLFTLACLTKTFGIFLCIPLFFGILTHRKDISLKKLFGYIGVSLILPLSYCIYMYYLSGNPFVYIRVQELFFRHSWREPFHTIVEGLYSLSIPALWNCMYILFALAVIYLARKKIPTAYMVYGVVYVLFTPTTGVLEGSSRYMTSLFVIPVALASMVKSQEKKNVLLMTFSLIQGFAIFWWVIGVGFAS